MTSLTISKKIFLIMMSILMSASLINLQLRAVADTPGTVRVEDYPGNGGGNYQSYGAFLTDDPHFTGGIYYEGLYTLQSGRSISNPASAIKNSWALCIRRNTSSGGNTQSINQSVYNGYGQYPVYTKAVDSGLKEETLQGLYYIISNGYPYQLDGLSLYDAAAVTSIIRR